MAQEPPSLVITRRRLPHWKLEGGIYFVTFRLLAQPLREPEIALVLDHIKSGSNRWYLLIAAVVMPDHVHLLLRPNEGVDLSRIMKGIKGVSSRQLNRLRKTTGISVWQDESYDRIVRDQKELDEKLEYMLNNPVKAGLVADGWQWIGWYFNELADHQSSKADKNVCPTQDLQSKADNVSPTKELPF